LSSSGFYADIEAFDDCSGIAHFDNYRRAGMTMHFEGLPDNPYLPIVAR